MNNKHQAEIVAQFTRQAIPFTQVPGHLDSLSLLVEMAQVTDEDSVLDLACGPGLVTCEFARHARHVSVLGAAPPGHGGDGRHERNQPSEQHH